MSEQPAREDFPPGLEGFKAWRRACGDAPEEHEGPWDPAKWGDFAQGPKRSDPPKREKKDTSAPKGRPTGPVKLEKGEMRAEIYTFTGPPPSDLRVRTRELDRPGADALNLFFKGVHPMELQNVLPAVVERQDFLLAGLDEGNRLIGPGREAMMLVQTDADHAWELTLSEHADHDGMVAHGHREDLVALAMLYADTVLGSVRGPAQNAPWVAKIRTARQSLASELGDHFVVDRT